MGGLLFPRLKCAPVMANGDKLLTQRKMVRHYKKEKGSKGPLYFFSDDIYSCLNTASFLCVYYL